MPPSMRSTRGKSKSPPVPQQKHAEILFTLLTQRLSHFTSITNMATTMTWNQPCDIVQQHAFTALQSLQRTGHGELKHLSTKQTTLCQQLPTSHYIRDVAAAFQPTLAGSFPCWHAFRTHQIAVTLPGSEYSAVFTLT